ncbi:MAG: Bax inhibitor-1/YccA family protein, partial [Desulfobaccales bacterium]
PAWAGVTAPLYALLEGLFIGGISAIADAQYPGIVIQAVGLTFGTCLALLLAYKSGMIRASEGFKRGIVAATGGIVLFYLVSFILGLFGVRMPLIYGAGPVGIIFSLIVVTIAALNLVLDFDFIEQGTLQGAPKYMEWYGAFALMVTLIWLYLEILNLLMKLRSRE